MKGRKGKQEKDNVFIVYIMDLPVAEAVLMDPMNAALNHPVAQPVQPVQPAQVAQVAQPAQPVPVSMFDLVPGRRYIISNRE